MTVEIRPTWDPSGTVSVRVSAERRELVLCAEGELRHFRLVEERAERLGWVERDLEDGRVRPPRVSVGEVMCACLREWEAEQAVGEVTQEAVARAKRRGGCWRAAGERLDCQLRGARRAARVSPSGARRRTERRVIRAERAVRRAATNRASSYPR